MKVLIVDDDEPIRRFLRAGLEHEGWELAEAVSGEEGLLACRTFAPDMIVLDQMMPGMKGIEMAQQARAEGYMGPIVLFSAYLNPALKQQAEGLGLFPLSKVDPSAVFRVLLGLADKIGT